MSGRAVLAGTPYESGPPAVAVAANGVALVAWANEKDLEGASNFVQYCVIAAGDKTCAHSGNLIPAAEGEHIDGVHVLVDGGTFVILADVYGVKGPIGEDAVPEQEWQSTDEGATWSIVDEGRSVANGILSADTGPLNAVIVPGTGYLGFGWQSAAGKKGEEPPAPTFDVFPLENPSECAVVEGHCPPEEEYTRLEAESNPDAVTNTGGNFASEAGGEPGILAIFNTLFSNGPLGCTGSSFGTAFVYGSGDQSSTNSYNLPFGNPDSAWRTEMSQAACGEEYPVVGGGPSGFGVVENKESDGHAVFQRFNASTRSFGSPILISSDGELAASLSQDESGHEYTTFLRGGDGGPIALAYSEDAGGAWTPAATIVHDPHGDISAPSSDVGADAQGWVTWNENGSVLVQPFDAAEAISAAAANADSRGSDTHRDAIVKIECSVAPCSGTATVSAKIHGHQVKLASGHFSISAGGFHTFKLSLTHAGRSEVKRHKGRFSADVLLSTKVAALHGLASRVDDVRFTPARR
ncbi:MAG TPA: hypothetical protein VMA83_02040 [Solirubrobacteraceae bacterium]|nr:hypothetical protein [Solirubrobacteraceae bacterium]